ncbi:MAG: lamin tail domain-containing protein [Planctomycetota bacterium]
MNLRKAAFLLVCCLTAVPAEAALQITELMIEPNEDTAWEWFEIRNTGTSSVDLDGYIVDRLGDVQISATAAPNVDSSVTANTVIPPDGVAVLYDAVVGSGSPANFNDQVFRDAWSLPPSTPIIGLQGFPALTNTGTAFGLWPNRTAYEADLFDDNGTMRVGGFASADVSIDYRLGFPARDGVASISWDGTDSFQTGSNWFLNQDGSGGAIESVEATIMGGQLNSTDDIGNPGIAPGGTAPSSVLITEVMYDPDSAEDDWEWIEIYNGTPATLDFTQGYVLDDDDFGDISAANITSGSVPSGTTAVLFNDDLTLADIQQAWDAGGALGTNFIPVSNWPALANSGDAIGLWSSFSDYKNEAVTGSGRTTGNAAAALDYDSGMGWPSANDRASISLDDLAATPITAANWSRSSSSDGVSFNAAPSAGSVLVHPGGDIGSPGFAAGGPALAADLDSDADVDISDLLAWQRDDGSAGGLATWRNEVGAGMAVAAMNAVPEPNTAMLTSLLLAGVLSTRFSRR